ncbi:MAG TPA: Wzz/FepE/Etk N-terminal domain-containing protein, partial [Bryobacteraceae bacterium]
MSGQAVRKELLSVRDVADTLFRQSRAILTLCAILTLAIAGYFWLSPRMYESEMTILVKNTRADLIVTPDGRSAAIAQPEITDGQMATEIQLLSSADVFRKVVDRCDLGGMTPASHEKATAKLQKKVRIAPLMKSSMIRVRYASPDPRLSAEVLQALADAYFERHLQLHSNAGSLAFFQQQAEAYEQKVKDAEQRLVEFQNTSGVVGAPEQKDLLIRKVVEEQAALRDAQANRSETQKRVAGLRAQLKGLAPRITTQTRQIPNQYSVERLNTLLVELQNKRTELLTKFRPNDRMVTQADRQISDTRRALESAE